MVVKGGGFGLIGDIIVGIVGAVIAGWLLPQTRHRDRRRHHRRHHRRLHRRGDPADHHQADQTITRRKGMRGTAGRDLTSPTWGGGSDKDRQPQPTAPQLSATADDQADRTDAGARLSDRSRRHLSARPFSDRPARPADRQRFRQCLGGRTARARRPCRRCLRLAAAQAPPKCAPSATISTAITAGTIRRRVLSLPRRWRRCRIWSRPSSGC